MSPAAPRRGGEETDVLTIGSVAADGGSDVRFYVAKFKGRLYGHIRKFVRTGTYQGPTPAGVALTRETLPAVKEAVAGLSLEGSRQERELLRVDRGAGRWLVVRVAQHEGKAGLDFRDWVESAGYSGWSKKGVRLPYDYLPQVQGYLARMEVFFRSPAAPTAVPPEPSPSRP